MSASAHETVRGGVDSSEVRPGDGTGFGAAAEGCNAETLVAGETVAGPATAGIGAGREVGAQAANTTYAATVHDCVIVLGAYRVAWMMTVPSVYRRLSRSASGCS